MKPCVAECATWTNSFSGGKLKNCLTNKNGNRKNDGAIVAGTIVSNSW
jgi:hypothetical protein